MIEEIYIRDLGVIQEARLPFGPGLTVLTGETGAGKTMVLSALGLLLGERADTSAIRMGQPQAFVEGRWVLSANSDLATRVREAGAELEASEISNQHGTIGLAELIMNRSVSVEGRSRAAVSGRSVPVGLLSELGEQLVVVHGQSDQIRLRSSTAQREALDQFAANELASLTVPFQALYRTWKSKASRLLEIQSQLSDRIREADELRAAVLELEQAAPQVGEDADLTELASRLTHLEELRLAATVAHEAISSESFEDANDILGLLGQARRSLEQAAHHDSALEKLAEQLKLVGYQLTDVSTELASYLAGLETNSAVELEKVQERRSVLSGLIRKYGPSLEDVIEYQSKASNRLLELDSSTDEIEQLGVEVAQLQSQLLALAESITAVRVAAAVVLSAEVTAELAALAMGGAELVVRVEPASELTQHGADLVTILLAAYPGAEPRPLGRGASGGELSRIMLAIEVVLAKTEQTPTFIFDEVDAGVGGAAAIEVGRRLAMLAKQAQVIVVTHLAQVAAYANHHLRVMKSSSNEFTSTSVVALDEAQRVEELTRMLSGLTESDSGRAHASELLQRAKQEFN